MLSGLALVLFFSIALANRPPDRTILNNLMIAGSLALLIVAVVGRVWAALYLSGRKSKELCTEGPFSITRNPLYLSSLIGAIGLGMLTQSVVLMLVLSASFLAYYHFVIADEERRLAGLFGTSFDAYRQRVPRLFPWRAWEYRSLPVVSVQTRPFIRNLLDSSILLWFYVGFMTLDAVVTGTDSHLGPMLWSLP